MRHVDQTFDRYQRGNKQTVEVRQSGERLGDSVAIDALIGINPADELEGMIAAQLLARVSLTSVG
jgi:hypothetical protein